MEKIKTYLALALCCLMLCQTTVDLLPMEDTITTYSHFEDKKND